MKIPLYYIWNDAMFYVYGAVFIAALASLLYAMRRWLELKNALPYEEEFVAAQDLPGPADELVFPPMAEVEPPPVAAETPEPAPQEPVDPDKTMVVANVEEMVAQATQEAAEAFAHDYAPAAAQAAPKPGNPPLPAAHETAKAEEFVKGIYEHIAGIEARMGAIEESIARGGGNRHFTVKFLEGILEDYDTLSVAKIKARVDYLVSDLKENANPDAKNN